MMVLKWGVLLILAAVVGLAVYARLAPVDVARWHRMPIADAPDDDLQAGSFRAVRGITTTPLAVLDALQTAALLTPRTTLVAGSPKEGMMTFQTRSAFFGFPDYTTVAVTQTDGVNLLVIYGRLRFGAADLGVNAARVKNWLSAIGPLAVPRP